jgi:hypothetical protein
VRLHTNQKVNVLTLILLIIVVSVFFMFPFGNAAEFSNRSVTIGTSVPSAITTHTFNFDVVTSGTLGSIELEYCENSPLVGLPCTPPVGFSALSATLSSQTGETGFSIHANSTSNKIILTRTPAAASPQAVMYELSNITNPSAAAQTSYVRISSFASDDGTGARIDTGGVAFSTTGDLSVSLFVPPFLIFCVGVSVAPDCTTATGNRLDLGELSFTATRSVTSQFAGATNDVNGYVVTLAGNTMTSGNNVISAIAAPTPSTTGTSQYGINLRANTVPVVGQNPLGAGTASPDADLNQPNVFIFKNGTIVNATNSTDFNTFTVSYIVNVNAGQAPGIYSTTATYIATAQF